LTVHSLIPPQPTESKQGFFEGRGS